VADPKDIISTIALTRVRGLSQTAARLMIREAGSAASIVDHRRDLRALLPLASPELAATMASASVDEALARAEQEYAFAQKKHIRCLIPADDAFPQALASCPDAPLVLYALGPANLNGRHMVSIIGTRRMTGYGADLCRRFVAELKEACPDAVVVSGLAYGVDVHAHREALNAQLTTVGVLAHGLDSIYPAAHRATAARMAREGGLLTEYMSGIYADKGNFVRRNRIVAGISQAVVLIESAAQGGSLITTDFAADYGRSVCAFPGRAGDAMSEGCNRLIASHRAHLITSAADFLAHVGWPDQRRATPADAAAATRQMNLFPQLAPDEQRVYDALADTDAKSVNQIVAETAMPFHQVSAILYELEYKGLVTLAGGTRYRKQLT
jgi:DNA processing protein